MSDCPRCFHELEENRSDGGVSWQCPDCGGLLATLPFLRRRLSVEAANRIWQTAREMEPGSSSRECPFCGKGMVRVRSEFDGHDIELDACLPCQAFWFDRGEIDALPEAPPPPPPEPEPELSDEAREKLAAAQMEMIREQADSGRPEYDGETAGLPSSNSFSWATLLILVLSVFAWLATPSHSCGLRNTSLEVRDFWLLLIAMVWLVWKLGRSAEEELGGGRLMALWATAILAAGLVHLAAGCHLLFLFLQVSAEAFLAVLVWLMLQFPWARVASSFNRGRYFGSRVLVWLPLPFFVAAWGVLCAFIPSLLSVEGFGALPATLAAAVVGWVFHVISRRDASRHRIRAR